jgi:hypothetical protein
MVDILDLAARLEGDDPAPTPDELMLELMDLVALAFPTAIDRLTVRFVPNEDGTRPALSDLDAGGPRDAPVRPALGHTDAEVLDTINHLLGELANATQTQGGVRVLRGHLDGVGNMHGGRDLSLVEVDGTGAATVVMTRTYDASELRWLLFTPQLFAALNETAADEAVQGQRLTMALQGTARFDIDMKKAVITFSGPGREPQSWRFELLGSWLEESRRFLWGWGNDQVDQALTRRTDAVRQSSTGPGLRALSEAQLGGPEAMFSRLVRSVAVRIGATGVYRAPFAAQNGKGAMFLALFPA